MRQKQLKQFLYLLSIATLVFQSGCVSSTSFRPWSGPNEFVGSGGTVRHVGGIDIWADGEPPRKYRLLGLLDQALFGDAAAMALMGNAYSESRLANEAKRQGGDAIIFLDSRTALIRQQNGMSA